MCKILSIQVDVGGVPLPLIICNMYLCAKRNDVSLGGNILINFIGRIREDDVMQVFPGCYFTSVCFLPIVP